MTEERLVLAELLEKASEGDFLRAVAEGVLQLLMESGVEAMQGDRRARPCLPRPPAGRRVAVSVARRDLSEAARGRPHRRGCGNNRRGGEHRRQTRDRRTAYRSLGG